MISAERAVFASGAVTDLADGLVGLEHVAATEAEEQNHDGREPCEDPAQGRTGGSGQPLRHSLAQVLHGAAGHGAVGVVVAVADPERALGEFRGHTEQAAEHHPEGGARAADGDRHAHAGDVAQADRSGHGRGQRLEVGDLPRIVGLAVLAPEDLQGEFESAYLDETEVEGEDQTGEDEPRHDPGEAGPEDRHFREDEIAESGGHRIEERVDVLLYRSQKALFRFLGLDTRECGHQFFHPSHCGPFLQPGDTDAGKPQTGASHVGNRRGRRPAGSRCDRPKIRQVIRQSVCPRLPSADSARPSTSTRSP
jgi:hypothetical protein